MRLSITKKSQLPQRYDSIYTSKTPQYGNKLLSVGQPDRRAEIRQCRIVGTQPRHKAGTQCLWSEAIGTLAFFGGQGERVELQCQIARLFARRRFVGDRVHLPPPARDEAARGGAISGEPLGRDLDLARVLRAAGPVQPVDPGLDLCDPAPRGPEPLHVTLLCGIWSRRRRGGGGLPGARELRRRGARQGESA